MNGANNIGVAQLPAFNRTADENPIDIQQGKGYTLVRVSLPILNDLRTALSRISSAIKLTGTHVTILEICGADHVSVSLNKGDYIPVREGDELTRYPITELRVRSGGVWPSTGELVVQDALSYQASVSCDVLLAISYGRLIKRAAWTPGFRAGFPIYRGQTNETGMPVLTAHTAMGPTSQSHGTVTQLLKWGGTMFLRNLSDTVSLFLYYGAWNQPFNSGFFNQAGNAAESPDSAWEIFPHEVLVLDAMSRLSALNHFAGGNIAGSNGVTLMVAAKGAGNVCPFNVMLSAWGDASDPDAQIFVAQSPPAPDGHSDIRYDGAY